MNVPTIDISEFRETRNLRDSLKTELLHSCFNHGFIRITGHGIAETRIEEAFAWVRDRFRYHKGGVC